MAGRDDETDLESPATAPTPGERRVSLVLYLREGVRVLPLTEAFPQVVGRQKPATIVIEDGLLSRQHAEFTLSETGISVRDLQSKNGTRVNGAPVESAVLRPGDEVALGSVIVVPQVVSGARLLEGIEGYDRFLARLDDEVVRARTFGRPVALIMVRALDREAGHVSRWLPRMRGLLRPVDRVTIYGPGIAIAALPETTLEQAQKLAQSIVAGRGAEEPPLLCGVAAFPDAASSVHGLVDVCRGSAGRASPDRPVVVAATGELGAGAEDSGAVAVSPKMREVLAMVDTVAKASIPVLIHGETGTGKEIVARAIHERSPRRNAPLKCINCAAIPSTLLESLLFGHERGAFTGADKRAKGAFEQADGGTVFLDEVGELSAAAQAALLRVLETKRLTRVGGTEEIEVDIRVVAATHRDLDAMTQEGSFRVDLLYRLNAMSIDIPPLRDRPEDVPPLAERFREQANRTNQANVERIDPAARAVLVGYSWPGNVRELRNVIERAVVIAKGPTIGVDELPERVREATRASLPIAAEAPGAADTVDESASFKDIMMSYEAAVILRALEAASWNRAAAAEALQMPLRTLAHKMHVHGIRKRYDSDG